MLGMAMRQISIDERQHEALRQRAKILHVSEDELVRRAIEVALAEPPAVASVTERRAKVAELIDTARALGDARVGAEPYQFNREELYEEREARWTRAR
jgi:hypothetical protein